MSSTYGPYELGEKIASGGMATLYLGRHTRLGTDVAIKILPRSLAADESFIARFEREAITTSNLKHENIVSVIDFGKKDDTYYIVMEHIEGTDLRQLLERVPRFPVEIAISILEEVSYGLEAAHSQGVIHRDMKPGNILLSHTGGVKIVDFGLALQMTEYERLTRLTADHLSLGTPAYMSPEQALGRELDHRADIYSLGAMTYELFTGKPPYLSSSPSELKERIINDPPPSMRAESKLVTEEVDELVKKMMAKDPADRFQTMGEVLQSIDETMVSLENAGYTVRYRRKYLPRFSSDPEGFASQQREHKIEIHNKRGKEFIRKGPNEFHQARREFEIVLWLDSENREALAGITEIRQKLGDEATRDVASLFPAAGEADKPEAAPPPPATGIRRKWVPIAGGALAVLLFLLIRLFFSNAPARVNITSEPAGAAVSVRGGEERTFRATGLTTPCTIELDRGGWLIRVNREGMEGKEVEMVLAEGEERSLDLTLLPLHGWVVLRGDPEGAALSMRGPEDSGFRDAGKTLPCTLRVAQGEWDFRVENESYEPDTLEIFVRSGEIEYRQVKLHPPLTHLGWVVLRSDPPAARIEVRRPGGEDFSPIENATPCSLALEPGEWEIRMKKNCYRSDLSTITLERGEVVRNSVELNPIPGGRLKAVISPLFADFYLNGKRVAREKRAWEGNVSPCRSHELEVRHTTYGTRFVKSITVPSGGVVVIDTLFGGERGGG